MNLRVPVGKNLRTKARAAYITQNVVAPAITRLHALNFIRTSVIMPHFYYMTKWEMVKKIFLAIKLIQYNHKKDI
jgi:hypothetical protein